MKILIQREPSRKHIRRRAEPLNKAAPTLYRTSIVITHCSVVSHSWLKDSFWPDQLHKNTLTARSREKRIHGAVTDLNIGDGINVQYHMLPCAETYGYMSMNVVTMIS